MNLIDRKLFRRFCHRRRFEQRPRHRYHCRLSHVQKGHGELRHRSDRHILAREETTTCQELFV